jgi:hypothetical protein
MLQVQFLASPINNYILLGTLSTHCVKTLGVQVKNKIVNYKNIYSE